MQMQRSIDPPDNRADKPDNIRIPPHLNILMLLMKATPVPSLRISKNAVPHPKQKVGTKNLTKPKI